MTQWIDVRSDTVTQPTPAMREAMASAVVGDDVYGDDPTVAALEKRAADVLGKDAALFVPSGTFGNQLALFTHCDQGDEVIAGEDSHIVWHEVGAASVIAGVNLRPIPAPRGVLAPNEIRRRIRPEGDIHLPRTRLLCLENAYSSGQVVSVADSAAAWEVAQEAGLKVHLDGARIFNAAAALDVPAREIARFADSVMFCLSKGLAAPVGSMLVGERDFIEIARKKRKLMGGGLRQAGVLAAPGLIAIDEMSQRLAEDHANARLLAQHLSEIRGIEINQDALDINMVWFHLSASISVDALMAGLQARGIKANPPEQGLMRLVTHWQVGKTEVARIADAFEALLAD
ncbi:low-specificity L-threonine aldolase [Silvimonas amylolytica]|uniref:Threonine aldolase n=1 Tax=Silvimonas amylolytica TaxID=449663 RepID=A0ABQ2PLS4_9NEIS|nr:low-specificity L-threonine aldolase [Silvimonas amylolytica]GGP26563.1 threonine aldolase [Silvimonas amylolytica]